MEDNNPNLHNGMHTHQDVFIADQKTHGFCEPGKENSEDKGSISELKVYDFLKEEFKGQDCFMFHTFTTGLDSCVTNSGRSLI